MDFIFEVSIVEEWLKFSPRGEGNITLAVEREVD
jgi:hypothetical protein